MTPVVNLSTFKMNWRSADLAVTENMTSDDLHDHKNECFIANDELHIKVR